MNRVMEIKNFSDARNHTAFYPSPLNPANVRTCEANKKEDVEDVCRSFENYLIEMIVEEGKMGDLTDVEELLYCWKNLTCPIFIDLVCRFYGELCKDLFSTTSR
ncbi:Transcription repressor OFP17 [Forsythia ovata]|uniref:Transcription repressor OFP17 n=1 Tax=Forsythia ovata TaxID=205694 RepID=A0ABD1RJG1_9LAMI